jgi:dipeptidyl aminopeptidase/acylaminoacyl peptidase
MKIPAVLILLLFVAALWLAIPASSAQQILPTPTLDPYIEWTPDYLASRFYGAGEITIQGVMENNAYFTRYAISYPSDNLTIYGFMDIPQGAGPYPVIIALHGYIDPSAYNTLDYTTRYADAFAQAGYIVLHPNLRGYAPSDSGPNMFRVGMAIDVLNLIGIVQQTGHLSGALQLADPYHIGLWGHSMGGGIVLRVLTINPSIEAAVLYGAMGGDERRNFESISLWSGGSRGQDELHVPSDVYERIGPIYFLDRIQAAVSIHHGAMDEMVPPVWSEDLCTRLTVLGKSVECFSYPGEPHTFYGDGDALFIERSILFFDRILKAG